ncbi:MAG: cell wall anchor protein [Muribaculaceae bacterium]|nr:cell wall anchor protein [Muribaculaceae bacterium]
MTRHTTHRIILLVVLMIACFTATAGNTIVSMKLDSARVMMGKTVKLHINIVKDKGVTGILINNGDSTMAGIDIVAKDQPLVRNADNNRQEIKLDYTLQPFEPGNYELPPVMYVVGDDTLKSNQEKLVVDSIKVDPNGKIKDYKPLAKVPMNLFDFIPSFIADYWWAWLAGLLLVAFGIFAYFRWYKRGINPLKPVKKRLPPYEEAMQALSNLKSRNLWQNGQEKQYYTELTDILRVYIERRFGINAVEMTSTEIMESIKQNKEAHLANEQLNEVLVIADFVKFANMHTLADDNEISFQRAQHFVEQTKPAVNDEEGEENDNSGKEAQQ